MSQRPIRLQVHPHELPDSVDLVYYSKNEPWQAAAEVVGINLSVWAFSRCIPQILQIIHSSTCALRIMLTYNL